MFSASKSWNSSKSWSRDWDLGLDEAHILHGEGGVRNEVETAQPQQAQQMLSRQWKGFGEAESGEFREVGEEWVSIVELSRAGRDAMGCPGGGEVVKGEN